MALFFAAGTTPQAIISQVQQGLTQVRSGFSAAEELSAWAAGVGLSDLTTAPPNGPGMTQADAQDVLSAIADANGLAQLYLTGTDPRHPDPGYNYGSSIRRVLGPRGR